MPLATQGLFARWAIQFLTTVAYNNLTFLKLCGANWKFVETRTTINEINPALDRCLAKIWAPTTTTKLSTLILSKRSTELMPEPLPLIFDFMVLDEREMLLLFASKDNFPELTFLCLEAQLSSAEAGKRFCCPRQVCRFSLNGPAVEASHVMLRHMEKHNQVEHLGLERIGIRDEELEETLLSASEILEKKPLFWQLSKMFHLAWLEIDMTEPNKVNACQRSICPRSTYYDGMKPGQSHFTPRNLAPACTKGVSQQVGSFDRLRRDLEPLFEAVENTSKEGPPVTMMMRCDKKHGLVAKYEVLARHGTNQGEMLQD
ncbi:hypothetical protein T439DRAFT_366602 [Meredithblackwellia eburnea MCA 4105]